MSLERNYKLYVHIAPNGKKYYGITKQKPEHRWANGKGYDKNKHFASAIKKYGWDNIEHIVLHEGLDEDEAKELEQYMIQWYDTANRAYGYNITLGGDGGKGLCGEKNPMYGKQLSEEHKKKLSEAKKGKNNPEAKSVICITTNKVFDTCAEANLYYNITSNSGISNCCKGKQKSAGKLPDGTKLVWRYLDDNNNVHKYKKIICTTTNKVFNTLKDGAAYYNINLSNISNCCKGRIKSAGKLPTGEKLVWKYIDIIKL